MDSTMNTSIVCYMGGTCGDLITAIIDPRYAELNNTAVRLDPDRSRLKKPHLFDSDLDKDNYINEVGLVYNSIPSHDVAYHVARRHQFIGIVVNNRAVATWAAERFRNLHRPHVWQEMQAQCGADSVAVYTQSMLDFSNLVRSRSSNLIQLERILAGHAVDDLRSLGIAAPGKSFYQLWLEKQDI